jgi:hypothetical protein
MHSAVPYDALLGALASAAPDVYALDVASLERLAGYENLRVAGVSGRKILEPLVVVSYAVIGVEPGGTGYGRG